MRRARFGLVGALVGALLLAGCAGGGGTGGMTGSGAGPDNAGATPVLIGLVTKTDTNPYFIRIREAAITAAGQWRGAKVLARTGRFDGDNDGQVAEVAELVRAGVKGILITPSSSTGIVDALRTARARGVLVIALDTETTPGDAVDATYATDNVTAGQREGADLRTALGAVVPKIVMLDGSPGSAVDTQRHQGFLRGFWPGGGTPGLLAALPTGGDAAHAGQAMTQLLAQHPDLNAVYTINEPAAEGAHEALLAHGAAERVKLATIDGSCPGVLSVRANRYVNTVMQFPTAMAVDGVNAVMTFVTKGQRPPPGLHDTGSQLIANHPAPEAKDPNWALLHCWG